MKTHTLILISIILTVILLHGCKTTGQAYLNQFGELNLEDGESFAAVRTIADNNIALNFASQDLANDEIIIVVDKVPDGMNIIENSWNLKPMINDQQIITWLFAKNPPQKLGNFTINNPIPTEQITYQVSGTPIDNSNFKGKWGLYKKDIEGLFLGDSNINIISNCGDGILDPEEQCDDGNNQDYDGCSAKCTLEQPSYCGNGILEITEECDDGNLINGDGCSSVCMLEDQNMCTLIDFDNNGIVDAIDILTLLNAYVEYNSGDYNKQYDINNDNKFGPLDILEALNTYINC